MMQKEQIAQLNPNLNKSIPRNTLRKVLKYNKWVKKRQRELTDWKTKPWRTDLKKPFKRGNFYLSLKDEDSEKYPELKEIDAMETEEEVEQF